MAQAHIYVYSSDKRDRMTLNVEYGDAKQEAANKFIMEKTVDLVLQGNVVRISIPGLPEDTLVKPANNDMRMTWEKTTAPHENFVYSESLGTWKFPVNMEKC